LFIFDLSNREALLMPAPEKKKYNNPKKWLQALDEEDDYEQ
jgi:hypothetical protein